MIAAIYGSKDEADIIELSLRHMLAEGVDRIYISDAHSADGTREILDDLAKETGKVTVLTDDEPVLKQAKLMNGLAALAASEGASWIVPADIDEFFYTTDGLPLADLLNSLDPSIEKLYVRTYAHHDWNIRETEPKRLSKVIFRWSPAAFLAMGQHEVTIPGGISGLVNIRELQFRGFEHFLFKVKARLETLDPIEKARGEAHHYQRLEQMNDEGLRVEWQNMISVATCVDPIPTRLSRGFVPAGTDQ